MKKDNKIKMSSNRSFGLIFFLVFFIIAFWSFRGDFYQIRTVPLYVSSIFLILGLINSKLLLPLNKLWFNFGMFLGSIISPIIMILIFFIVVTPIGILMRILKKDLLLIDKANEEDMANASMMSWEESYGI